MLQSSQTPDHIRATIADFFERLPTDTTATFDGFDLDNVRMREVILPLAVIETRLNNRFQHVAALVENYIIGIFAKNDIEFALSRQNELLDMSECFDVLCYVGFRRAQLISSPRLVELFTEIIQERYAHLRLGVSRTDFRYMSLILRLARARFDTQERDGYLKLSETILDLIWRIGRQHLTIHEIYQLGRLFAYPGRIHPPSYAPLTQRIEMMINHYFDSTPRSPMTAGDNIVKEVAISIIVGRHTYGLEALRLLQRRHELETDAQVQRQIAQRLVEVAYYAGYDDIYGIWNPYYLRLLLNNKYNTYHRFIIAALMRFGRHERAHKQILRIGRRHPRMMLQEAIALRNLSRFPEAAQSLDNLHDDIFDRLTKGSRILTTRGKDNFRAASLLWAARLRDELAYVLEFERLSRPAQPPAANPKADLIVLCPSSFYAFTQIPAHVVAELRGRGCPIISMVPGFIVSDKVSAEIDARVTNSLSPHYYTDSVTIAKKLSANWTISFKDKIAEINGINFYFCLHNTIGITFRCYDIDWENPIVQSYVRRYMVAIEALFAKHDIIAAWCRANGRRARLVLTEIQHGLAHALRLIAERASSGDVVDVYHLSNGFEAYHAGVEKLETAQFQCIANVTRHPDVSLAYRPATAIFENWAATAAPERQAVHAATAYARKVITAGEASIAKAPMKETFRRKPGPVIILLGKILPDLPRPDDVGFIHADVKEWFVDCCRFAYENDINLVIKPHPAEFNSLISLYINQDFLSFMDEVPEHMRPQVVDRFALPITDLPHVADGVILWGGNSMVELALLGIPTMACGRYGALDCPVGLFTSDTREAFENFLRGDFAPMDVEAIRAKTISFLSYVTDDRHTIPSRFNNRSMYNSEVWPPLLHGEAITSDPVLHEGGVRMADYILGDEAVTVPETA